MVASERGTTGKAATRATAALIAANIAVWAVCALLSAGGGADAEARILELMALPGSLSFISSSLLARPWTLLTYMFTQLDFPHLVINMALLLWAGRICICGICVSGIVWKLYLAGGLAGAVAFVLTSAIAGSDIPAPALIGSSAAVSALVGAAAVVDRRARIVAVAIIALDIILGLSGSNIGGHLSHIGGLPAGMIIAAISRRLSPRRHDPAPESATDSGDTARVIEKIRNSGYSSLSTEERRMIR